MSCDIHLNQRVQNILPRLSPLPGCNQWNRLPLINRRLNTSH
jgi:hypothetical protein